MTPQAVYLIVENTKTANQLAELLDDEYNIVASWVAGETVHHILTKATGK